MTIFDFFNIWQLLIQLNNLPLILKLLERLLNKVLIIILQQRVIKVLDVLVAYVPCLHFKY